MMPKTATAASQHSTEATAAKPVAYSNIFHSYATQYCEYPLF